MGHCLTHCHCVADLHSGVYMTLTVHHHDPGPFYSPILSILTSALWQHYFAAIYLFDNVCKLSFQTNISYSSFLNPTAQTNVLRTRTTTITRESTSATTVAITTTTTTTKKETKRKNFQLSRDHSIKPFLSRQMDRNYCTFWVRKIISLRLCGPESTTRMDFWSSQKRARKLPAYFAQLQTSKWIYWWSCLC